MALCVNNGVEPDWSNEKQKKGMDEFSALFEEYPEVFNTSFRECDEGDSGDESENRFIAIVDWGYENSDLARHRVEFKLGWDVEHVWGKDNKRVVGWQFIIGCDEDVGMMLNRENVFAHLFFELRNEVKFQNEKTKILSL